MRLIMLRNRICANKKGSRRARTFGWPVVGGTTGIRDNVVVANEDSSSLNPVKYVTGACNGLCDFRLAASARFTFGIFILGSSATRTDDDLY
ncbi:MAG: hypothetical protein RLZZ480_876 [Candidatus Parcubacteria bacterium]|jgi:hypothetical protein